MIRIVWFLWAFALSFVWMSCNDSSTLTTKAQLSPEEQALVDVDSLKARATEGDLVVRLTDDVVSEVIKNMNESDKSFSHAGVIVWKDNQKMVCNIIPDEAEKGADTIRYEPLDSFINPKYNLAAALFRYPLNDAEKQAFLSTLDSFRRMQLHFDEQYDYITDDKLYCSEMIAKALYKASNGRIICKKITMPEKLVRLFMVYYKKYNHTEEHVRTMPYVPIDNLYRVPGCTELMRIKLKYITGDSGN